MFLPFAAIRAVLPLEQPPSLCDDSKKSKRQKLLT
jgi:hypothetical protein